MRSQSSFGTRLDNAKKIAIHLATFAGYNPPTEISLSVYNDLLAGIETHNADTAGKAQAYSNAMDTRRKAFKVGNTSLFQASLLILDAIHSQYGKESQQAADIKILVTKLTGQPGKKPPKPPAQQESTKAVTPNATPPASDAEPKTNSRSESGFGNMLKTYGDIVATIKNYGTTYTPGNPALTTDALVARFTELSDINRNVTVMYSALKQNRLDRLNQYKQLAEIVRRSKYAVKSQYGRNSTKYAVIGKIKV